MPVILRCCDSLMNATGQGELKDLQVVPEAAVSHAWPHGQMSQATSLPKIAS